MKNLELIETKEAKSSIAILHFNKSDYEAAKLFVETELLFKVNNSKGLKSKTLFLGKDKERIAIYFHWETEKDCRQFMQSDLCFYFNNKALENGWNGKFHAYHIPYINDSEHGKSSIFSSSYRGIFAINEVKTLSTDSQEDLTRIMIRTDEVAKKIPFQHSTNLHVSSDKEVNLNILQFRYSIVKIVVWFILRFGKTTEALKYGTPDVHFYKLAEV
jgi:heme-degrading monooxygenase HmoA